MRLASFGAITANEMPGNYLANHPGPKEQLVLKPGGTFELRYSDATGKDILSRGAWKFLSRGHSEPDISLSDLAPGRNPFPRDAGDYSAHDVWPKSSPGAIYYVGILRDKLDGTLYIELHPDLNDYYEKQQ
jgi:hypothetical protein